MKNKYTIIEKFHNLTSSEMKLIFYMMECQDQSTGCVKGLYYRDAVKHTGMCKQSFYNALRGLEKKNVIKVEKNSDLDYDIQIYGNAFPWKGTKEKTYQEGYVNLTMEVFHSEKFRKLKAHEKYLLLEFLKRTHEGRGSFCAGVQNFYEKWGKTLGVTKRVIRGYLHRLRDFFAIGIKNGKYYITYLHSIFKKPDPRAPGYKRQELYTFEQWVRKECNRLHISYTADALEETAIYIMQYRPLVGKTEQAEAIVMRCIEKSVKKLRRCDRTLDKIYVHKLVIQELEPYKKAAEDREAARASCADGQKKADGNYRTDDSSHRKHAFTEFHQRDYDWDNLELLLLNTNPT